MLRGLMRCIPWIRKSRDHGGEESPLAPTNDASEAPAATITIQPSRELDALIHEVRTGQKIPCTHSRVTPVMGSLVRCEGCGRDFGQTTLAMARDTWPRYTSDLLAAWELAQEEQLVVFPRLSSPGWCAAPWLNTYLFFTNTGSVHFHGDHAGKASTVEMAISLAYLSRKGMGPEKVMAKLAKLLE